MLFEAHGISRFVVVCGYTDLRKGIQGLSQIIEGSFHDYLIEQVRIANLKRFGRQSERLDVIDGQLSFFDEAEA